MPRAPIPDLDPIRDLDSVEVLDQIPDSDSEGAQDQILDPDSGVLQGPVLGRDYPHCHQLQVLSFYYLFFLKIRNYRRSRKRIVKSRIYIYTLAVTDTSCASTNHGLKLKLAVIKNILFDRASSMTFFGQHFENYDFGFFSHTN